MNAARAWRSTFATRARAEALAASLGDRALAVPGDITADGAPDEIVRRTLERFGRIDILVNNAAFARSTRFPNLSAQEFREALEVNLTAPFLLTKAVLPTMQAQHYGRIINISSSAGRMVSTLGGAHYTASKAGLLGLTRAAAKELGKFGITVNAVCPGMIDTELTHENAAPDAARAPGGELSGSAPRHRTGSRRPHLLRRVRGGGLHHRDVARYQRRRSHDVRTLDFRGSEQMRPRGIEDGGQLEQFDTGQLTGVERATERTCLGGDDL